MTQQTETIPATIVTQEDITDLLEAADLIDKQAALMDEMADALREAQKVISWCIHNHDAPDTKWEENVEARINAVLAALKESK